MLIPTHNLLRSKSTFDHFVSVFQSQKNPQRQKKILILETEDGKRYINDGHHFLAAALKCGINLSSIDMEVMSITRDKINSINFSCRYFTPYNPITHVRKPDFYYFKLRVSEILNRTSDVHRTIKEAESELFIYSNMEMYQELRVVNTLSELLERSEQTWKIQESLTQQLKW
jgi:hypothetical protein